MLESLNKILVRLQKTFDPGVIINHIAYWLTNIIIGLFVLLVFFLLWKIIRLLLLKATKRSDMDKTAAALLETLLKYGLFIIGLVTALNSMGIEMSAVMASLGIVGLTIGFAARDALSNLISGILIFIDRPFLIGDLVEIDGVYGKVDRITLRSSRVITVDGKMMAVPNTQVVNKTVASYTNFPHLRLDIPITVAVTENLDLVRSLILGLVLNQKIYLTDPAPRVVVAQLNDYNVMVQLQVWVEDERQHQEI